MISVILFFFVVLSKLPVSDILVIEDPVSDNCLLKGPMLQY